MLSTREESPLFEPIDTDSLNPIKAESNDNYDAKRQKVNEPSVLKTYSGGPLNVYIPGEGPYFYEECESVPRSPAYHPNVEQCRLLNKQAMEELLSHIVDGEQEDFEIQRLSQEFSDKRHIQMTNKMVMALDGDTGSGKSTTINSILGKTILATKGCGGASCTQVVAEYADNPNTQGYEAHVHILPHEVIHDRMKAHVKKFRAHHQPSQSDDEPLASDDDLAGEADTALEYFRTLFCDRPECRTDQDIKDLLLSPSSTDAVALLMQWIVQIKHSLDVEPHDTKFTIRATGLPELLAKTSRCTEKMNLAERTSSLWPIVEKIRFFLNSPFLRQGLELVDLPGLSDANEDRRNSSLTYLQEFCSGIIVVATVDRPETHPSVIRSVKRAIRLKGPSNVILVLTRTDDCPENPNDLSQQENAHLKILQYALDASKTTFAEGKQKRLPRHELQRLRDDKKFAEVALQKARILIRNQHLVQRLQSYYREFTGATQLLRVVPVSNACHQEHLAGFDEEEPPCLGVEDDGIRNVRHELLNMLGYRTIETLKRQRVTVNSLLTGLDLWLQRSRNDRKDTVIVMVKTHLEKCNKPLAQHERSLIAYFNQKIHAKMTQQLRNVWQDKIVLLVEGWGKQFNAVSFKAFCRREGVHQPKGHDMISMNEAVLAVIEKDMDGFERLLVAEITKHSDDLTVYIDGVFGAIENDFENEHNTAGIDMRALIRRLDQRRYTLGQTLRDLTTTFKADLHVSMMRAQSETSTGNTQCSDFIHEMKRIYGQLNQLKGKGVHARRVPQMHDSITDKSGPFLKMGNGVRKVYKAAVEDWAVQVEESLRSSLEQVLADIDVRFIGPEMPEEERNELREGLKSILPDIYNVYEQCIPRLIEGCKEWAQPEVSEHQASQPWEHETDTGGL